MTQSEQTSWILERAKVDTNSAARVIQAGRVAARYWNKQFVSANMDGMTLSLVAAASAARELQIIVETLGGIAA